MIGWSAPAPLHLRATSLPPGVSASPSEAPIVPGTPLVVTLAADADAAKLSAPALLSAFGADGAEVARVSFVVTIGDPANGVDPTFGVNGVTVLPLLPDVDSADLSALVPLAGGSILAVVRSHIEESPNGAKGAILLARYRENGQIDPTYGNNGVVVSAISGTFWDEPVNAFEHGAELFVGGWTHYIVNNQLELSRYHDDGGLDPFGDASAIIPLYGDGGLGGATAFVEQSAGAMLVGYDFDNSLVLSRRLFDGGAADPSFADGGFVVARDVQPYAVTTADDDTMFVAGYACGASCDPALMKLRPDGSHDTSFGSGGVAKLAPAYALTWPTAVALDPQGRALVAGVESEPTDGGPAVVHEVVARFLPNGSPDTTFGVGGVAAIPRPHTCGTECGVSVVRTLPGGKTLIVGTTDRGSLTVASIVRLDPSGALDPGFGVGGEILWSMGPATDTYGTDVVVQSSGAIVLGGIVVPRSGIETTFLTRFVADHLQ